MNSETSASHSWAELPDHGVPDHVIAAAQCGPLSPEFTGLPVRLSTRKIHSEDVVHFHAHLGDSLIRVYEKAANTIGEHLLPPPPSPPLDGLLFHDDRGEWSPPPVQLDAPLWEALAEGMSRHLGIDYRLIVRINTKWGVPSAKALTPRLLLTEFGFDPAQFTLYHHNKNEPLPPDVPIELHRGEHFEAQKDGRYGGAASLSVATERGLQTIEEDVAELVASGQDIRLFSEHGQTYVEVTVDLPTPSWSKPKARILLAVPSTYPTAGLDAFYVEDGVTTGGALPRKQSVAIISDSSWNLVSWHYATKRPWNSRIDDLQSHITHCCGFFLARGVSE
ncbi:MAG: E2/UBC family protein [Acidobacteriaceae bacterium]